EPTPGQVDHVDVRRAQRDPFLQDARALVDQGIDAALDDLPVGDLATLDAELLAVPDDQLLDGWVGDGVALARLIPVPARAGLLTEPTQLADAVGEARVLDVRLLHVAPLADEPSDVVARQVGHAKGAHRQAPFLQRRIHLPR